MLTVGKLSETDPAAYRSLSNQHSKFIEVDKSHVPNQQAWSQLAKLPDKSLKQVIRPRIVANDRRACEMIVNKMQTEGMADQVQRQFF